MATTGYASALGGLAKDAVIGAGKGFVGGLKGAMMSEAPGLTGAYAFGKELRSRANAPKLPSGGSAPPSSANKPSSSSPAVGGLGITNDKSIVAGLRQSNIINLEQVRQLKQLNDNVINQSKLLKFTVDDTKRKDQFAEEVAKEQAFRDDQLLDAIKRIGSSDKKQTKADDKKESSFLGNLVDLISDNIGTLIAGYLGIKYGGKVLGAVGSRVLGGGGGSKVLGGIAGRATPLIGMAGRGAAAAADVIDVQARVISSSAARGALATGIRTVVPMVLSFLTGPIGLGIMAAAGIFALLKTASNPNYVPGTGRVGKSQVDNLGATDSNKPLKQDDAKTLLEDANRRKTTKSFADQTDVQFKKQQAEADRDLNAYGGRQRVENAAQGLPEYRTPGEGVVSSLKGLRDLGLGAGPKEHNGVDLKMNVGTKITPIAPGTVTAVDTAGKSGLGRFVTIQHADGTTSTYAHLKEVNVKDKETVDFNTPLGLSGGDGNTDNAAGASTGPHLHLEVKRNGKFIDPATLSGLGALGEKNRAVKAGMYTTAKAPVAGPKTAVATDLSKGVTGVGGTSPGIDTPHSVANPRYKPPTNPPISIEANAPYFTKTAETRQDEENLVTLELDKLIAKRNKIQALLEMDLNRTDGEFANPIWKAELIQEYKDDIKKIDEKIVLRNSGIRNYGKESNISNKGIVSPGQLTFNPLNKTVSDSGLNLPNFANLNMLKDFPFAHITADASGTFLPGGGGDGTRIDDGKPIKTVDEELNKRFKAAKFGDRIAGTAVAKQSYVDRGGNLILAKAPPPFKPDYKSNTEIIAEANKQFLNELRSTLTGLTRKELKAALLPDGVGVSFGQANQDNLFRGEQLKQINDTSKKINEGAINLFGKKFGPMFAPMLDRMSTSYFEVGSRLVGRQLFTRFGGLDAKETMGITGQVLGNIAAGKKQLAAEQLLFGMSGGRKTGIALNAESLFAKYGFEDPEQGISYFADVLGEKATQYSGLPALMGANDRNKSIVRDPRTGKSVYVDSGIEASKEDIKAGYGGRISQTSMLGENNNYMEVPGFPGSVAGKGGSPADPRAILNDKGEVIGLMAAGTTKSSVAGGSFGGAASKATGTVMTQYTKVSDGKGNMVNPTGADLLGITPKQFNSDLEKNTLLAEAQTAVLKQNARADGIRAAEALKAEAKIAADAATNSGDQALAAKITAEADRKANEIITIKGAEIVVDGVKQAAGGGKDGGGTNPIGLVSGRRPGQLFDATNGGQRDEKGNLIIDPMKEIGNFGFDILKLAAGSELTKGISNPYMQTIANFAIQKGMNAGIEAIMGTGGDGGIFSKIGSMFSGGGGGDSGYGGYGGGGGGGGIFSTVLSFFGFKDGGFVSFPGGGPVVGSGTGTSDSIPAYVSNGEFVVNARAAAANMDLLNAINQSTLRKKTTSGSGTYVNDGGPGSQSILGGELGLGPAQDRGFFRDIALALNDMNPTIRSIAGALIPGFSIASFFSSRMAKADLDASNVIGGQSQKMSAAKESFRASEIREQNETEAQAAKDYGKTSWGKTGNVDQDIGQVSYADVLSGINAAVAAAGGGDVAEGSTAAPGERGGEQLAKGGLITGKGSGTSDSIFAMLSNGEFVINAKATKANLSILKQINSYTGSGSIPKSQYDSNLSIEPFKNTFKGFADGGLVTASTMNAVPRPTSRSPYILSPPTNNSSSENQNNSSNMIIGPKTSTRIDNSSVTNFYNQASGMIDSIRSVTPQVA
jgi:murein DD-endopeptidase MepM/ murein hydrolase activator NlpD